MAFALAVLSTCALLLWLGFLWSRRRFYKVAWQMPGPLGLPFVGLGFQMMNPETFLGFMERISERYKTPFISWMGTKCFLYVNDPETVETVFNSAHCTNKGDFYRFMSSAIGDGLFTSSSPRWNKHRRLINPAFSRQVISDFLPIFNAEADFLLQKLAAGGATGTGLEIYGMLKKSVLEAACQTTMGKKMNFQNDGSSAIFDAYNGVTEVCVRRMLSPWLYPDLLYRLSPLFRRQQKVVDVLFGFVENLLQRCEKLATATKSEEGEDESSAETETKTPHDAAATEQQAERGKQQKDDDDVGDFDGGRKSKSIFVEQMRKHVNQGHLSWEDVRDEANVTIAATFETTSTALYLVCLCLAMHPEHQEKLYEELLELFPDDRSNDTNNKDEDDKNNKADDGNNNKDKADGGNDDKEKTIFIGPHVSHEHLDRMPYTEMVINEAMRLFAPVPMVLRQAAEDLRLRDGSLVPRGTQIGIDIYNMQRSHRVWGPRAHLFDPVEHFGPQAQSHAFAFVPFTRGLRMCIGYRYALMLMKVLLVKIFRNFRIRTEARLEGLVVKGTISLKLREYPLCQVTPR